MGTKPEDDVHNKHTNYESDLAKAGWTAIQKAHSEFFSGWLLLDSAKPSSTKTWKLCTPNVWRSTIEALDLETICKDAAPIKNEGNHSYHGG